MEDSTREDRLLMLAISGEPLPDDDPDAAAVAADVALLRDQLKGLGDALGTLPEPVHVPVPVPAPHRHRRRPLRLALGSLAAAGALALAGGMVWVVAQSGVGAYDTGGGSDKSAADSRQVAPGDNGGKRSPEGLVACSRVIAEGTVLRVVPIGDTGEDRVTLRVTRWYKPASGGARTLTFPMDHEVLPRLRPGDQPLITIPNSSPQPDHWALGEERDSLRATVLNALPGASTC
ncbi:hypothetical protein AB0J38_13620 [Streptomyces sp. NPDC050095]|uniref:hypothetical protein n=1 Tax=unclassified Streptomyces TaxID=2593676 RepID=UPI0034418F9F